MAWDSNEKGNYAWFTKQASEHGGVNSFIDDIYNEGYQEGHESGIVKGIGVATIGMVAGIVAWQGITYLVKKVKTKKKAVQQKSESAKAELRQICKDSANDTVDEEAAYNEAL